MYFFISFIFLLFSIFLRRFKKNSSLVTYLLYGWLVCNVFELLNFFILKETNMGFYGCLVNIIISVCSILTINVYNGNKISNRKFFVGKSYFNFLFFMFLISAIPVNINFFKMIVQYNFDFVKLLLNKDLLLQNGIMSYLFLFGMALLLMLPYTSINAKHNKIIKLYILLTYAMHPKRTFLFFSIFYLIYESFLKKINKRIPKKYYKFIPIIVIALVCTFHFSQVLLKKSVYNSWNSTGEYNHFEATILDISAYVNGNISNTDKYLELSNNVGHKYPLNNTFYPEYSLMNTFGIISEPPVINNFFIKTGNLSTNTINAVAYYIDDLGIIYAFFIILFIFVLLEVVSRRDSHFKIMIYPLYLYSSILFFRQNDFLMIFFYITNILVFFSTIKFVFINRRR